MIVRILIWSLHDAKTTFDELRGSLPELGSPSAWIWNEATERFGIITFGDDAPEAVGWTTNLIGDDPDVYEEFDVLDV